MDMLLTFLLISVTVHVLFPPYTLSQQKQNMPYQERNDTTYCDYHGICGPNGNCDLNKSPACFCLDGFKPVSLSGFDSMDYTQGCVRNKALNCKADVFFRYAVSQEPSGTYSLINQSLKEEGCKEKCLSNCSCTAYYVTEGGCKLWSGDLFDVRVINEGGHDLFIRMPASEQQDSGRKKVGVIIGSISAIISVMILTCCSLHRRRTKLRALGELRTSEMDNHINEQKEDLELPLLELSRIAMATDNFSVHKKLGEGGFGPVYKGTLDDGQEVAVKRLSICSEQGLNELKTEVKLIAKLQHRNLVRLIGCCIQEEEKLLIYEYMPNRSLNYFIFGQDPLSYHVNIKHERNSWIGLNDLTSFAGLLGAYYIFIKILD